MIKGLRYKLRMFKVPIDDSEDIYCENEAMYKNTVMTESVFSKEKSFNFIPPMPQSSDHKLYQSI